MIYLNIYLLDDLGTASNLMYTIGTFKIMVDQFKKQSNNFSWK